MRNHYAVSEIVLLQLLLLIYIQQPYKHQGFSSVLKYCESHLLLAPS